MAPPKKTGRSADASEAQAELKRTVSNTPQLAQAVAMVKKSMPFSDLQKYNYDFRSVNTLTNQIGDVHSESADWNKFSSSITDRAYKIVATEYVDRVKAMRNRTPAKKNK